MNNPLISELQQRIRDLERDLRVTRLAGGSKSFSGTVYVNGKRYTGLSSDSSKPYVKVFLDGQAPAEDAGPAPDPFPANVEYFRKDQTPGDIHVIGAR